MFYLNPVCYEVTLYKYGIELRKVIFWLTDS